MQSNQASGELSPVAIFEEGVNDTGANISKGTPLCLDVGKYANGSNATARGQVIPSESGVSTFVAKPSASNIIFFAGVAIADPHKAQQQARYQCGGVCQVRVKNTTAAAVTLGVGQPLIARVGQDYFEPKYVNAAAGGTTKVLSMAAGRVHAAVTVSKEIAAGDVEMVWAHVYLPSAPQPFLLTDSYQAAADVPSTSHVMIAPGPGIITRAGFGVTVGGAAGNMTMDVLINGVSIFTTQPKIVNDCTDPCHTLTVVDTAVATYLGTAGSFGLINTAARSFDAGDIITRTMTNASSFAGTGYHCQIEGLFA